MEAGQEAYCEAGMMEEMIPAPTNRTRPVEAGQEAYREAKVMAYGIPVTSNRTRGRGGWTEILP